MKSTSTVLAATLVVAAMSFGSTAHCQDPVSPAEPGHVAAELPTTVLVGEVVGSDGERLPGIEVEIRGPVGVRTLITDAQGRFRVPGLPFGEYTVEARLPGFAITRKEVALRPGGSTVVRLILGGPVSPGEPNGLDNRDDAADEAAGNPAPVGAPPLSQARTLVVEKQFEDDIALQESLNEERARGHELRSVITLAPGTSLFVYERQRQPEVCIVLVDAGAGGALTADRLAQRIRQQSTKTFVGIHWLPSGAPALIFRDGR